MAYATWSLGAVTAARSVGLVIDYDIVSLLASFVLITVVFGAIGGMAHHFVIVLQYRRPLLRGGEGDLPKRIDGGERADYIDGSLWAAGFVGTASAVGFVFFIIAMLGMESGFKAVMAVKVMSLSVIAGFAGRTLLTAMASNVTKQYVDNQVDAIAAQVAKKLEDSRKETMHQVHEQTDQNAQTLREEMDRREKASARNVRLLELNVKLTAALTDPSLIKVAIADADGMIQPERGNTMAALWINYARALKYDGRIEEAVKSLMRFVAAVNDGEMDRNHNYDSAIYNLACYTSLLAERYGGPEREQMLTRSRDFLAAYLKSVGYKLSEVDLAKTDPDLKALRQGTHFAEALRH